MSKTPFEKAKDYIIKAGFSHIKLEMEADMGREDCDNNECCECYGDGYVDCYECEGHGVVVAERPNGSETEVECDVCDGSGRIECEYCDGSGEIEGSGDWSDDRCEEWIKDYVSEEARDALTYSKFYYDGSVDSEMTFTIPVKNAEYLVEYLQAFSALGDEIGNGLSTGGAGLHITVIPASANGNYPAARNSLDYDGYENFQQEVRKLLPALLMLASPDERSRDLGYRQLRISDDDKYSAIYAYDRSTLEYRIFETCYDKPEMIKEYIEVIAKTLRFYVNKDLKVEALNKQFKITNGYSNKLSRFYKSSENISILRNQLKYLRPEGKSIANLMKEREIPTITELNKQTAKERAMARKEWYENKKRRDIVYKTPMTEHEENRYKMYIANGETEEVAMSYARGFGECLQPLQDYINQTVFGTSRYAVQALSV